MATNFKEEGPFPCAEIEMAELSYSLFYFKGTKKDRFHVLSHI